MARTKAFDEEQILHKALKLFWCKGYEATSMQDLVEGLGINRSSMYDTFGDKKNLFLKALKLYRDQQARDLINFLNNAPAEKTSIARLLDNIADEVIQDADRKGCFMVNTTLELASRDKDVEEIVVENNLQVETAFRYFLVRLQENGQLAPEKSPIDLARFLLSSISGMKVSAVAKPDPVFLRSVVKSILKVVE